MERSPITYVDQMTAPLFVIQGANDPRVSRESDQIVDACAARAEVRYDVYEDEGHGFTKRENQLRAQPAAAESRAAPARVAAGSRSAPATDGGRARLCSP